MEINLKKFIRDEPNFPKAGILFKDISPLLGDPAVFAETISRMKNEWTGLVDSIAMLDARGFIFGGALAYAMGLPIIMLRKVGKLPGKTIRVSYDLEYGSSTLEVQKGLLVPGSRVLIVDDLLATGGTALAACTLIEKSGAKVGGCAFVVELSNLAARKLFNGQKIHSLVDYSE